MRREVLPQKVRGVHPLGLMEWTLFIGFWWNLVARV